MTTCGHEADTLAVSSSGPWEACADDDGNTYYYNTVTQETTWEPPTSLTSKESNHPYVEAGWQICEDEKGREYYYNQSTDETAWDLPMQLRPYAKPSRSPKQKKAGNGNMIGDEKKILQDIWLSKEELRAKAQEYVLTVSDRLMLEREQRAKKRAEIREAIAEERKRINRKNYEVWEPAIVQAKLTGSLNCSWKGFRVVHPKVYELTEITALRLVGNALNDVPRNIGLKLRNLQVLSLSCNGMTFVPKSLGLLTRLTRLNLQKNRLQNLPEELCNLTRLTHLDLTNNLLVSLPDGISRFQNISRLSLERNCLARLPKSFGDLKLQKLVLSANSFFQFPSSVHRIRCLTQLSINQNNLESLPESLCELQQLEYLSACNNSLTDLPEGITKLKNLKRLWLDWNGIEELPEGFRFLENLTDLRMEGNPMRFPMIELIQQGGASATLRWCRNRHRRDVRVSKRSIIEALQRFFRLLDEHSVADKSIFEPNTPHDNGFGVVEQYYAFQIDALYDVWLPAVDALEPEKRNFRKAAWLFPYPKEQLLVAMREYVDSSGTCAGLFDKEVLFRKCSCTNDCGERVVCIPPKPGYLCRRTATLVKMQLATNYSDQMRRSKVREKKNIERAREKARRDAQKYIARPDIKAELDAQAREAADSTLEDKRRAEFLKKKTASLRAKRAKRKEKMETKRVKLIRARKERIENLKREKSTLMEQLKTANEFEIEVIEEDIKTINETIHAPPEDKQLKDLGLDAEAAERKYHEAIRKAAESYTPRGSTRKKMDRLRSMYKELMYDIRCKIEEKYIVEQVEEAEKATKHRYKCMRVIISRWSRLSEAATFSKWKIWAKRRIERRLQLRKLRAEREKLRKQHASAAEALRQAEYAKWEKQTDPFTGSEYYKHCETGEEVFDIPIRDWSDNPQKEVAS